MVNPMANSIERYRKNSKLFMKQGNWWKSTKFYRQWVIRHRARQMSLKYGTEADTSW